MPRYTDNESEIFESFVKIANEKGLISKAKPHEYRSPKEIADLHGVKPDMIPGMKYDKNILEVSHPDTFVVLPTHDRINGLLENITERHNIMVNIVQKRTHGNLNTRKLVQDQLMKSLVKVANDLDNRDAEELRVLADACIDDLTKQAGLWEDIKGYFSGGKPGGDVVDVGTGVAGGAGTGAVVGAVIGGLVGGLSTAGVGTLAGAWAGAQVGGLAGGLLGGLTADVAKTGPHASSVSNNAKIAIDALKPLISKFPKIALLTTLNNELTKLKVFAEQYATIAGNPDATVSNADSVENFTKAYLAQMDKIKPLIGLFQAEVDQGDFASATSHLLSWFMNDDAENVTKALGVLDTVIDKAKEGMDKVKSATQAVVAQTKKEGPKPAGETKAKTLEEMVADLKKQNPDLAKLMG